MSGCNSLGDFYIFRKLFLFLATDPFPMKYLMILKILNNDTAYSLPMKQQANENLKLYYIIISRDAKIEKKCTLYPLRGRKDFSFRTKEEPGEISPDSILLTPQGEPLTSTLAEKIKSQISNNMLEVVLVDSRWEKAKSVVDSLPEIQKISLYGYETGAIRKDAPPYGGLASCEALYLTSLFMGKPNPTLLDKYHFKDRFFRLNNLVSHKL